MFDVFYIDGKKPNLFRHERQAKSLSHARELSTTRYFWVVTYLCDYTNWDFLWEPLPWESHQCHAWRSQWQKDSGTYLAPAAGWQDTNYHAEHTIPRLSDHEPWAVPKNSTVANFDFSWHPDPGDPPYIYQFGTQHQVTGGPRYLVPGATDIKYVNQPRATRTQVDDCWIVPTSIDRDAFDFTWHPDDRDPPYIYQFGTQHQATGGPKYVVPGAVHIKYVNQPRATRTQVDDCWTKPENVNVDAFDWTWHPDDRDPPYVYQFGTQHQRTGGPKYIVQGATEVKYVGQPRATKTGVDQHWHIPDHAEFQDDFDWTWHPDESEIAWIYQFGTQHQRTGGPQYRVPGATDIKFVEQIKLTVTRTRTPVVIIDHLCGNVEATRSQISQNVEVIKTTRYIDSYLGTLQRIAQTVDQEWLWICSSVCDYGSFDFTWYPEQWQASMLHVFSSGDQKFGDTFYVHVPTFRDRIQRCQLLEWYDVNFVPSTVRRRPMPVIQHAHDSQVTALSCTQWSGPLALFAVSGLAAVEPPVIPLWRPEVKTVTPLTRGASAVIVPREAQGQVRAQMYDYPYIDRSHIGQQQDQPLDIVFISNGESTVDAAWHTLEQATLWRPNLRHRVDGVTGRVAAYHSAARASTTPWFFAVFAKLFVADHFDWSWQPDRMQQAKHYIFHARNPVNGLEYGHQAMIAYNRDLVLANTGHGLDFTLDDAHEVVPILSGIAFYADTPWMAWRTAFREALKLRASLPDVENEYRLQKWLAPSTVTNGDWSQWGAEDAVEYYDSVSGDLDQLRLSYEWAWLASYAFMRRNLVPDQ